MLTRNIKLQLAVASALAWAVLALAWILYTEAAPSVNNLLF